MNKKGGFKLILYSTGCSKCKILKDKMDKKDLDYIIVSDIDEIRKVGRSVPLLSVDGVVYDFRRAIEWIKDM